MGRREKRGRSYGGASVCTRAGGGVGRTAPGRRSGRWSRTARRGPIAALTARSSPWQAVHAEPAACPCGPPARVYGVSGKIPGAVPLSPAGGLHGLAAGAARPRAGRHRACRPVRGLCTRYGLLPAGYRPGAAAAVRPLHGRRRGRAPSAGAAGLCCTRRFVLAHALPCRRAARRTGWRSAVRACCCGGAKRRKARCFPALMIPTPNFRAAAARAAPVSAPPWTAAQSVLPIRRWARRTAGSMNRLPCAAGSSAARLPQGAGPGPGVQRRAGHAGQPAGAAPVGRAPAAGAAAGIPRRKARAVQRRKCRIGGIPGCGSGIFRSDGRIRKGRDKMTLLIVVDMQSGS